MRTTIRGPVAAILASVPLLSIPNGVVAEPFGFRGVTLGSSLAELRRLRYPEAPSARILCSHDAEARDIRPTPDFVTTDDEAKAGVKVCSAFNFGPVLGPTTVKLPPEWTLARVKVGNIDARPMFWFTPGSEASAKLYRITLRSNTAFWDETKASFERRYGKPTSIEKGSIRLFRGVLDNETVTWSNPESTIRLVKRTDSANRMTIVFQHSSIVPTAAPAPASGPGRTGEPAPSGPG